MTDRGATRAPSFDPRDLAAWCGGTWHPAAPASVSGVTHDSRSTAPGNLYVALKGEHHDGHDFVDDALSRGAAGAVVSRSWAGQRGGARPRGACLLCVEDPKTAIEAMAHRYRESLDPRIIAVTGSVGKTSVKEMIACMLAPVQPTAWSRGNWNNAIGLPLSLLSMPAGTRVGVFELGINHPDEMVPLCKVLAPDWGVITNVAAVHMAFFDSLQSIAHEKSRMLSGLPEDGLAVLNKDDAYFPYLASETKARVVCVSLDEQADYLCVESGPARRATTIREAATGESCTFCLHVPGRHHVINAMLAAAVGRAQGLDWEDVASGLERYRPLPMRWEQRACRGVRLVNDSYNASPVSMRAALETLERDGEASRTWLVLADMLELGTGAEQEHRDLGGRIARGPWQGLVTLGPLGRLIAEEAARAGMAPDRIFECSGHEDAVRALLAHLQPGDVVLFKASRGMKLERVVAEFEKGWDHG